MDWLSSVIESTELTMAERAALFAAYRLATECPGQEMPAVVVRICGETEHFKRLTCVKKNMLTGGRG